MLSQVKESMISTQLRSVGSRCIRPLTARGVQALRISTMAVRSAATTAPVGGWTSPISSELITSSSIRLGSPAWNPSQSDHPDLFWLEGRPSESGRVSVVRIRQVQWDSAAPRGLRILGKLGAVNTLIVQAYVCQHVRQEAKNVIMICDSDLSLRPSVRV